MADAVTVYVRPHDAQCDRVRSYLDEKGIAYTLRDVTQDPGASAVLFGYYGKVVTPVVRKNDTMVAGYDPIQLAKLFPSTGPEEEHVRLGAAVRTVTAERAAELGLPFPFGVEVGPVGADSPASEAGIHEGDVILTIGSYTLDRGLQQFQQAISSRQPGTSMDVEIWRQGSRLPASIHFPATQVTSPEGTQEE